MHTVDIVSCIHLRIRSDWTHKHTQARTSTPDDTVLCEGKDLIRSGWLLRNQLRIIGSPGDPPRGLTRQPNPSWYETLSVTLIHKIVIMRFILLLLGQVLLLLGQVLLLLGPLLRHLLRLGYESLLQVHPCGCARD